MENTRWIKAEIKNVNDGSVAREVLANETNSFVRELNHYEKNLKDILEELENQNITNKEEGISSVKKALEVLETLEKDVSSAVPEETSIWTKDFFKAVDRLRDSCNLSLKSLEEALEKFLAYIDNNSDLKGDLLQKAKLIPLLCASSKLKEFSSGIRKSGTNAFTWFFKFVRRIPVENFKKNINSSLNGLKEKICRVSGSQRATGKQEIREAQKIVDSFLRDVTELQDEYEKTLGLLIRSEISFSDAFETMQGKISNFDGHMCDLEKKIKDIETAFQPILLSKESHERSLPEDSFLKNIYLVLIIVLCIQGVLWYTDNEKSSAGTVWNMVVYSVAVVGTILYMAWVWGFGGRRWTSAASMVPMMVGLLNLGKRVSCEYGMEMAGLGFVMVCMESLARHGMSSWEILAGLIGNGIVVMGWVSWATMRDRYGERMSQWMCGGLIVFGILMAVMMYMKEGRNVERSTGSYMVFIMTVVVGTAVSYACGKDYRQLASKRMSLKS
ncbi:DUF1686 domain-containing protein [Encephalitozoon intestinalis]|nr:DUF1686 domain-containing protein [Encephalitozoon intestinalis]